MRRASAAVVGLAGLVVMAILEPALVAAHPFHTSFAEGEHDRAADRLEVSIRVIPEDLERILEERTGRLLDLDDPRDASPLERAIADYLRDHFAVVDPRGHRRPLRYIGREGDNKATWLHLEIDVPDRLVGHRIENTLFFDLQTHQVNTLVLAGANGRTTYTFAPGHASHPLATAKRRR